jgi:hypothetical protein
VLENVDAAFAFENVLGHTDTVVAELRGTALVCTHWCGRQLS